MTASITASMAVSAPTSSPAALNSAARSVVAATSKTSFNVAVRCPIRRASTSSSPGRSSRASAIRDCGPMSGSTSTTKTRPASQARSPLRRAVASGPSGSTAATMSILPSSRNVRFSSNSKARSRSRSSASSISRRATQAPWTCPSRAGPPAARSPVRPRRPRPHATPTIRRRQHVVDPPGRPLTDRRTPNARR